MVETNGIGSTLHPPQRTHSKNPYLSKWNILFDKVNSQWISFKPKEGHKVFPCYSCRDMFGSKTSFIDHVNRRGMLISYRCPACCINGMTFYNPCSFMLHVRQHFSTLSGRIDLENLTVSTLPLELAGFFPHPKIPLIYNVEEDDVDPHAVTVNTRFYSPMQSNMGQRFVNLMPNVLLFHYIAATDRAPVSLVLKAISTNIPRCRFIVLDMSSTASTFSNAVANIHNTSGGRCKVKQHSAILPKTAPHPTIPSLVTNNNTPTNNSPQPTKTVTPQPPINSDNIQVPLPFQIKDELTEEEDDLLEKSSEVYVHHNGEDIQEVNTSKHPRCSECKAPQRTKMIEHFIGSNRPTDDSLKCVTCNYVAPTNCSLSAHKRIHQFRGPFVCPECGTEFPSDERLMHHLDTLCFHLAKQVRFRCNGRLCSKIFAQSMTFSAHFLIHMPTVFKCTVCSDFFLDEVDFSIHAHSHKNNFKAPVTFYKCTVCSKDGASGAPLDGSVTYTAANYMEHISWHCTDPAQRVYVYICKYCRSYFRSSQTYAVHLQRCSKRFEDQGRPPTINRALLDMRNPPPSPMIPTHPSGNGTHYIKLVNGVPVRPPRFQPPQQIPVPAPMIEDEDDSKGKKVRCIQCLEPYTLDDLVGHLATCPAGGHTANKSQSKMNETGNGTGNGIGTGITTGTGSGTGDKVESFGSKKRKRPAMLLSSPVKGGKSGLANGGVQKRSHVEYPTPEPVELPTEFKGIYYCKVCDFNDKSREIFQEHIRTHRNISTAYQCMDCGECFVVKPSLIKHILYYHHISDTEAYFSQNDCFDKRAVSELVSNINKVPGESSEPVAENQCKVCRLQCENALELNKHFRVHGMAFINIRNKTAVT